MTRRLWPRRDEATAALASGALLALSFPPFHLLLPPFVALVPWLVFLDRLPPGAAGRASALRAGYALGIVYFGSTLYWLFAALVWYTPIALVGYLLTVALLSGWTAGVAWAVHRARDALGWPLWSTAPVAWTAGEWLQGHLPDVAFPWLGLGTSLTGFPWLVGAADLVGARGITFWLVGVNALAAATWRAWRTAGRLPRRKLAAIALACAVPTAYSLARWATLETRPAGRVAILQPNIPEHLKLERAAAKDSTRRAIASLTETLPAEPRPDLIVWPEVTYPDFLRLSAEWTAWIGAIARQHGAPVVAGGLDFASYGPDAYDVYNTAFVFGPDGEWVGTYDKRHLVPVVERVPFVPLDWVRAARRSWQADARGLRRVLGEFLAYFGGFGRGAKTPVFAASRLRFGVLICYESIFAPLSRRYRQAGADVLVNITNDAWFGRDEPWWSRTAALYQHPAHLVMRAIENRVGVARSANTGISLVVDPRGRVTHRTPLFRPAAFVAVVETTDERTLYTRWGDVVGWGSAIAALLGILAALAPRRRA